MLSKVPGSTCFSLLDFRQCYLQFELHPESRNLTTFVTHFGHFHFTRMVFGMNLAAKKCQKIMDEIVREFPDHIPPATLPKLTEHPRRFNRSVQECVIIFLMIG